MGTTTVIVPAPSAANAPANSDSVVLEAARAAKTLQGVLFGVSGYNKGPAQYIQVHDSAAAPSNGAVPKISLPVAIGSVSPVPFALDFGLLGRGFVNGIYICNSTTGETLTAGAADCWFNARYK